MNPFPSRHVTMSPANESLGAFFDASEAHGTTVPTGVGNCLTRGHLLRANLSCWGRSSQADRRERSDTYAGEIHRCGDWRVALCRDGVQWLLQTRRNPRQEGATAAWDSVGFCQTHAALLRLWRAQTDEDGAALEPLLPERISRRAARGR